MRGRIFAVQMFPGFVAVAGDDGIVAPLGEHSSEHGLKDRVVFGGQDFHAPAGRRLGLGGIEFFGGLDRG